MYVLDIYINNYETDCAWIIFLHQLLAKLHDVHCELALYSLYNDTYCYAEDVYASILIVHY